MAGWNEWLPGRNMTLTEVLDALESARVGLDVKDKLYWSFYKIVELAIKEGNANFDVAKAAGNFKDLASRLDASDDKLSGARSEIVGARRGYQTLFESLNNLSFGMFNINLGKITPNMVSDELLAQIAGDAAVNASPADKSVTTPKIANKAVKTLQLGIDGYLPKTVVYNYANEFTKNRVDSEIIYLLEGTEISAPTNYSFNVMEGDTYLFLGWRNYYVMRQSKTVKLRIRKNSDSDFSGTELAHLSDEIKVTDGSTAVLRKEITDLMPTKFQFDLSETEIRASSNAVQMVGLTKISIDDETLEFSPRLVDAQGNPIGHFDYWRQDMLIRGTQRIQIMVRKKSDGIFTQGEVDDLSNKISVLSGENPIRLKDAVKNLGDTAFVSPSGNDLNGGDSVLSAFATLQKAIDSGATTIKIAPGNYEGQTVNAKDMDRLHIYALPSGQHDPITMEQSTAKLTNGKQIDGLVYSSNMYTGNLTLDTNDFWKEVFIDKSLTPEITDAYVTNDKMITYNAVLWQVDPSNPENTMRLKPVLTLGEVRNNMGTFYYDGSVVHIYPRVSKPDLIFIKGIDRTLTAPTFENIGELIVSDVDFLFQNSGVSVKNVSNYQFIHSDYGYTTENSGFIPSDSNGVNKNSKSYFNQRDGFGPIGRGKMDFEDCYGYYNADDGISHHSYTTGVIRGGEYHHNQKGGVIPTQNTKVDVHNVISHNNKYGFNFRDGYGQRINLSNVVAYDNEIGISVKDYDVQVFNGKFVNNVMPTEIDNTVLTKFTEL